MIDIQNYHWKACTLPFIYLFLLVDLKMVSISSWDLMICCMNTVKSFILHLLFYFSSEVYSFTCITLFYIIPFSRSRVLLNYIFSAHLVLMSLLSSSLILEGLHLAFGLEGYFCWMHTQCSSGAFPSGLEIYPSLPFWPLRFLLRTSLLFWQLWLYIKLDASVFMLLLFFCCSVLRLTVITCYKKIPF